MKIRFFLILFFLSSLYGPVPTLASEEDVEEIDPPVRSSPFENKRKRIEEEKEGPCSPLQKNPRIPKVGEVRIARLLDLKENAEHGIKPEFRATRRSIDDKGTLYLKRAEFRVPEWIEFFNAHKITDEIPVITPLAREAQEGDSSTNPKYQSIRGGAFILQHNGKSYAFLFGKEGRHLLNREAIDSSFSRRVGLNAIDPQKVKSISKSYPTLNPLFVYSLLSQPSTLENHSLAKKTGILRSIKGIENGNSTYIEATDSHVLYKSKEKIGLEDFSSICEKLEEYDQATTYKKNFPWALKMTKENDKAKIEKCNIEFCRALVNERFDEYEFVNPLEVGSLKDSQAKTHYYKVKKDKNEASNSLKSMEEVLECVKEKVNLSTSPPAQIEKIVPRLKRIKIYAFNKEKRETASWNAYQGFTYFIERPTEKLFLNSGLWYRIDNNYVEKVNAYIKGLYDKS